MYQICFYLRKWSNFQGGFLALPKMKMLFFFFKVWQNQMLCCIFVSVLRKRKVKLLSKISHNMNACIHSAHTHTFKFELPLGGNCLRSLCNSVHKATKYSLNMTCMKWFSQWRMKIHTKICGDIHRPRCLRVYHKRENVGQLKGFSSSPAN